MNADLDASELHQLVDDLSGVVEATHTNVRKAVQFTAFGIKKAAQESASGIAHAPHYPRSITYTTDDLGAGVGVTAEVGPDKDRMQGALGNFLEYGDPRTPPQPHLGPALDKWTPDLLSGLEKAAADALEAM